MKKDLSKKFANFNKATSALGRALARTWQNDEELRDAVIQRFEFSLETCWKFYQAYFDEEGIITGSPKAVFRQMLQTGLINSDECQFALNMVDDRNQTSHTYNQEVAEDIASRVPGYYQFLLKIIQLGNRE